MAFTHEDGSGVQDANAYATIAEVTAYLTDRGRQAENTWSTRTTAEQEAAIIKASDYIDKRWGGSFRGKRNASSADQGLEWPRTGACDDDGFEYASDALPKALIQATAEYAVRAVAGELSLDPESVGSVPSSDIRRKTEKVGPLEDTTEYFSNSESVVSGLAPDAPSYPAADLLMQELVSRDPLGKGGVSFGRVARA